MSLERENMAKSYKNYSPVRQYFKMSCWAACMEWMSIFMSPQKPILGQGSLIYQARDLGYSPNVDAFDENYGGMEIQNIQEMLKKSDLLSLTTTRLTSFTLTPEFIREKLAKGPVFIAYYEPEVSGAHANVIINCKTSNSGMTKLRVMEPKTPVYTKRELAYYYNDGDAIIGWQA